MGITSTDCQLQTNTRTDFLKGIVSNMTSCNIGVYIYLTTGRASNRVVVFKIPCILNKKYQTLLVAVSAASPSAMDYITQCKLCDAIANIGTVVNSTRIVIVNFFDAILPDNITQSINVRSKMEVEQIAELSDLIN